MGAGAVERFAEGLQGLGGLAVTVGLFAWLAWPVALLVLGVLAVACGVVLEIGTRPRTVAGVPPLTAEQRRAHSLADLAAHQSGR
jgi:TM2 domain-containing membrane protein YozV